MKILHISDTHSYHRLLNIDDDIDMIIHSGDCSNYRDPYRNEQEVRDFITWFESLKVKHKIYVAGNHDTSIERGLLTKENFTQAGIHYLENESIEIEGINIWGSPHTPNFGNWAFMKDRSKLNKVWESIPDNTDIVVVHGPPKGVLDLAYNRSHQVEFCGCSALKKRILKLQPKLFMSGHIHNNDDIINAGIMKLACCKTIFSNGSVVTDRKFGILTSFGNIFDYEKI